MMLVYIIKFKINNLNIQKHKPILNMEYFCFRSWIYVLKHKLSYPIISISKHKYKNLNLKECKN